MIYKLQGGINVWFKSCLSFENFAMKLEIVAKN